MASKAKRPFPMYVLKIADVLDLERMQTHEEMTRRGKLIEFQPGMKVLFVSHTWLHSSHPDSPSNVKLILLQDVLRKFVAGKIRVPTYWQSEIVYAGTCDIPAAKIAADLSDGYIWLE